ELEDADDWGATVACTEQQILDVVEMSVGCEDQVGLRRLLHRVGARRIAGKPGGEEHSLAAGRAQQKCGVPEPRNRQSVHAAGLCPTAVLGILSVPVQSDTINVVSGFSR